MNALRLCLPAVVVPGPLYAHDAFGDLGPFYASLLHPLADPLQAVLLIGTAAFLAGRPLPTVRTALPLFILISALSYAFLFLDPGIASAPLLAAGLALLAGLAAMLPDPLVPRLAGFALVAATGALAGIAPGAPQTDALLQTALGTVLGLTALTTLAWFALETGSQRLSPLVPRVAGSWVAAIGILVGAFSI